VRSAQNRSRAAAFGVAALLLFGGLASSEGPRPSAATVPSPPAPAAALAAGTLAPTRLHAVALSWHGGPVTAATGERVTIFVSDSYTPDQISPQTWADFFGSLIHGSELPKLVAYVATPAEVTQLCGANALACAGGGTITIPGQTAGGLPATAVATHEYGHFIALNRINPPWRPDAFGAKRWASAVGVCARVAAGTAFPGDEGERYRLNPGEGFAESYRILNETKGGASAFSWPIVDSSFYPDANALAALNSDVVSPWLAPTQFSFSGRFLATGTTRWKRVIATPLDGVLTATLIIPSGGLYQFTLVTPDGRTTLATGLWSGAHAKTLSTVVCGERNLVLSVVRRGPPGRFTLQAAVP